MPNKRKVKLFGFELTMTSALLLFIFFGFVIIMCMFGLYQVISTYNTTSYIPTVMLFGYIILFVLAIYIVVQSLRYREKKNRY